MNVFFYGYNLRKNAGGIERYTSTILHELKKRGHRIFVYVLSEGDEDSDFTYLNKVIPRIRFVDRFIGSYRISRHLRELRVKIDLFLCGHIHLISPCEKLAKRFSIRYDLFVYGIDCWGTRFKTALPVMNNLRHVISISSFTTEQVRKQGYQGNVVYFPPLIDVKELAPARTPKVQDDKIVLLTVARLDAGEQYKGQDTVIQALDLVLKQWPDVEYWIVGSGNDRDRLEHLARSLGVNDHVKFLGFVSDEDLVSINQRADICVLPSKVSLNPEKLQGEGFGIVLIEAAMYRKALIASNIGGSTDIVEHEVNGLRCNPENVEDVADCIVRLCKDQNLRHRLGENAYRTVEERFSLAQFDQYVGPLMMND